MVCVVYFCLDTKVPKNQDQYGNRLGSGPPLRKGQKLAALKQLAFLFARKVRFHPAGRRFP
jgi:hypothetical protein